MAGVDDALFKLCRDGDAEEARRLIASEGFDKANIDAPIVHFGGHTPLTAACWFGHLAVVQLLVNEAGASVQQTTGDDRQTPLHVTATYGHMDILRFLVEEAGADVNAKDGYGDTPTRFADNMMKADAVAYLQEHGGVM